MDETEFSDANFYRICCSDCTWSCFWKFHQFCSAVRGLILRLIKFIIAPLILATLVVGVASNSDTKQLGRVGIKTLAYYLVTTGIAVVIGLAIAFAIQPGKGVNIAADNMDSEVVEQEEQDVITTLLNIIPENPFTALTEGNILQIIFFVLIYRDCHYFSRGKSTARLPVL